MSFWPACTLASFSLVANEDQVRSDFSNHEFKISTLDRNIIRMAVDFETFQMAINKIHAAIVEL